MNKAQGAVRLFWLGSIISLSKMPCTCLIELTQYGCTLTGLALPTTISRMSALNLLEASENMDLYLKFNLRS